MSLNPNGAPAGYYYQAGATAYLVDPAGTYSGPGASAPTPADPGTYIPFTGATSEAVETVDPAGTYSNAGASAPTPADAGAYIPFTGATSEVVETVDPAGTYSNAGASAPTPADAGAYIPFTGATSEAVEIVDPAGTYSGLGASAPTPADPGAYIPFTGATSESVEIGDPAGTYSGPGASAPTTDPAGTYSSASAIAPTTDPAGTYSGPGASAATTDPAGTYSAAGASAPTTDPAGTYSRAGASAPTLAAAGTYIPVTGATSAAAQIVSPPGTYAPPGASAPIADPGGTYSARGASAPTTDPAGTYSSPYALNRLVIEWQNNTPDNTVLSFNSATAVANYYGATSTEATLAKDFFAVNYGDTSATMLFTRLGLRRRPHLLGANIGDLTLNPLQNLQSINGSLAITFQGYTYSAHINLSGVTSFSQAAGWITAALNQNLQVAAVTAESSIARVKVLFTGSTSRAFLTVTSVSSGSIEIGALISGPGILAGTQIISQVSGTPGGVGVYNLFVAGGNVSSETITETYGVLTVGAVTSGTVAVGQQVTGAGVAPLTAIDGHLSGSGPGSTWLVNIAPVARIAGENMTMTATPLSVLLNWNDQPIIGATENNDFFNVAPNGAFGYDFDPSSLSYMSGTAAAALGLAQGEAIDSSPGGLSLSVAELMNMVQSEDSQWSSFQSTIPNVDQALAAWAQANGYQFLTSFDTTPPAGSSTPTIDPAGTFSPAGASAPTPAAAGTYIPGTGATSSAAEIVDPAGTYSLAGASAYTYAQPGYYVPTPGASSETPDTPGYYTPDAGQTRELLALPPTISGTVAGQSTPSGQPDTPFSSATIADKNINTSDSLTIELTGGGGALADGAGFSGLTESTPGVYILSGTAAAITSELEALVFTPDPFSATTTFALTDTTSLATSASNANTAVTVTNGEPVDVSVQLFLADQATLDGTPGGFDILDTAGNITAGLNLLNDPHIDAIVISDNGNVVSSVQQLTTDATAISKLQNANLSPVLLAINDTAGAIQTGLATLVADAGEIVSITESNGPIVVSAATYLADHSALDKIVGGFAISDAANAVEAKLDRLDDLNITAITISDNGRITASVAQLTADATAIGDLRNANASPVLLAINDTAGAIQTGLATLVADAGEIVSITESNDPIVVSAATFLADQSTLDKIMGGFDVSDTAANLVADLSTLNADSNVAVITAAFGDATLSGSVGVNAPNFSETGWGTSLTVSDALAYAGTFSQGEGSTTAITIGTTLLLMGTASLSGTTSGAGTLALAGGSATIDSGATVTASTWMISGAGTDVTLGENLTYSGAFSEDANDPFVLSGGNLVLSGADTFSGGTVSGSRLLETEGTTTVSGLTIGGTAEWENTKAVTQSGGTVTIGGTLEAAAATLDFKAGIYGTGKDKIAGASTMEFDSSVAAGQTASFTGSGGELALHDPSGFAGVISGFDTAGAGSNDTIEVAGPWVFTGFTENAQGTHGDLGFANGASTLSLTLIGDYTPANFVNKSGPNGSTLITYA